MTPLPLSMKVCRALIDALAFVVPPGLRKAWTREWHGRIWHHWQFLHYEDAWTPQEALGLFLRTLRAIPQAFVMWWLQEDVQHIQNLWLGSPWTTLGALLGILLLIGAVTGGYPATSLLFHANSPANQRELFVLLHPAVGGGNKPLPSDVVPAWAENSHLLDGVAPFLITRDRAFSPRLGDSHPLVIKTDPSLFRVLQVQPAAGKFPVRLGPSDLQMKGVVDRSELVIDYRTAGLVSQMNTKVIGSRLQVGRDWYRITAVLPKGFRFLTRQPVVFLVQQAMAEPSVMVVAAVPPGVSKPAIDRELTKIAEDKTYYFFASQLRLQNQKEAILLPLSPFFLAALSSGLLALGVCGFRMRDSKRNWKGLQSRWALRRIIYFTVKTSLALLIILIAGLEGSRRESSILLASKDPANGPLLLWFFIAGTMAVFFWSIAEGRMRCRTCLRRLCSPVRVGSPGCLLLDWSGTELVCNEGHGVLHIPHMATSWQSDAQRWITMDESWAELFTTSKKGV